MIEPEPRWARLTRNKVGNFEPACLKVHLFNRKEVTGDRFFENFEEEQKRDDRRELGELVLPVMYIMVEHEIDHRLRWLDGLHLRSSRRRRGRSACGHHAGPTRRSRST